MDPPVDKKHPLGVKKDSGIHKHTLKKEVKEEGADPDSFTIGLLRFNRTDSTRPPQAPDTAPEGEEESMFTKLCRLCHLGNAAATNIVALRTLLAFLIKCLDNDYSRESLGAGESLAAAVDRCMDSRMFPTWSSPNARALGVVARVLYHSATVTAAKLKPSEKKLLRWLRDNPKPINAVAMLMWLPSMVEAQGVLDQGRASQQEEFADGAFSNDGVYETRADACDAFEAAIGDLDGESMVEGVFTALSDGNDEDLCTWLEDKVGEFLEPVEVRNCLEY